MRFVYNVLYTVFFFLTLPYYVVRLWRRGNWQTGMGQRFGIYQRDLCEPLQGRQVIWFHAVSVGEVNLCAQLIKAFGSRLQGWRIVVSTTTTTGMGELERKLPDSVVRLYYPLDFPLIIRRALQLIRPKLVVLVEAEIWPNLLWSLADRSIPTFLVNARLSDRSARRYRQFGLLFESLFASFSGVGVQNPSDAETLRQVGCRKDRIVVTGNLKFDVVDFRSGREFQPQEILKWAGAGPDATVLLASSTHAGEERLIGRIFKALRKAHPGLFLVVVPRHFERRTEVGRDLAAVGIPYRYRSSYGDIGSIEEGQCLVVDSTGELRFFYETADVVVIGKSLLAHGGQNPIEPAAAGCAVVMGPFMENFRAITQSFVSKESAIQVPSHEVLEEALRGLLDDPGCRDRLGRRAQQVVTNNQGAVERTVAMIQSELERSPRHS